MVLYLTNFALVFSFLAVGKVFLGWVVTNSLLFEAGMHLIPQLNSRLFPFLNSSVFEKQLWNVVDEVHPSFEKQAIGHCSTQEHLSDPTARNENTSAKLVRYNSGSSLIIRG